MNPKAVIDQLSKLRNWNRMTAVKREAIDKAIKAVEAHEVAKEPERQGNACFCPVCKCFVGIVGVKGYGLDSVTAVDDYCKDCGQKLKAPRE